MSKSEKIAVETPKEEGGRKPDFILRCRSRLPIGREHPNDVPYITIGALWSVDIKGKPGYSVKINSIPPQFDGSAVAMVPLTEDEREAMKEKYKK